MLKLMQKSRRTCCFQIRFISTKNNKNRTRSLSTINAHRSSDSWQLLEKYAAFHPSPLSLQKFLDFGKYISILSCYREVSVKCTHALHPVRLCSINYPTL